jgi:hypothetical protein
MLEKLVKPGISGTPLPEGLSARVVLSDGAPMVELSDSEGHTKLIEAKRHCCGSFMNRGACFIYTPIDEIPCLKDQCPEVLKCPLNLRRIHAADQR